MADNKKTIEFLSCSCNNKNKVFEPSPMREGIKTIWICEKCKHQSIAYPTYGLCDVCGWRAVKEWRGVSLDELKNMGFYDASEWLYKLFFSSPFSCSKSLDGQEEGSNKTSREVLSCRATPNKAEVELGRQPHKEGKRADRASALPKSKRKKEVLS